MTIRLAKILMCLALGAFAAIVAVDNVLNYDANYAFVQHVMSMDTTGDASLRRRAVTDPRLWRLAYAAIIACEAAVALGYLAGAARMWTRRRAPAADFANAKSWVIAASTLAFFIWFAGFEVVAGEWFAMWQSQKWNGQQAAFRIYMTVMAVLIFVSQPDAEVEVAPPDGD